MNENYGYAEFISGINAIVMGRATFEKVLTFAAWPYDRKVFVLSSTMRRIPESLETKAELLSMKPREVLDHLEKTNHANVYIDGGRTIQSFLRDNLIDELIVTRIPVLIGSGIPLFGELDRDLHFTHIQTTTYTNGLVKSHYRRKRD